MSDREEKVLKGLECCSESISNACPMECPYRVECLMQDDELHMYSVMHAAIELLKSQPELKHGYWKLSEKYYYDMVCSVCGETALTDVGNDPIKTYYCPWCGAKMDEQEGQK